MSLHISVTKQIEDVVLTIPMAKTVTNVNLNPSGTHVYYTYAYKYVHIQFLFIPSAGIANYDPVSRVVNWNVSEFLNMYIYVHMHVC